MSSPTSHGRVRKSLLASLTWGVALVALAPLASSAPATTAKNAAVAKPQPGTIGLAITDWRNALNITPDATECSLGEQKNEPAQARAQKGYVDLMFKYGGTYENRGPNGERANTNPDSVEDPLPFSELTTKVGFGFNLDGTADGGATAKTCKHEKFTSPEGVKVDHQMSRVIGCVHGNRNPENQETFASQEIITSTVNRRLIEITGVDDEMNDPQVQVTLYKGRDVITRTAAGDKFLPMQSHRIDERFPKYNGATARGKIVDGVLITEPFPQAHFAKGGTSWISDYDLKDMVLRIKLTPDGAQGMLGGYEDITTWWNLHSKSVTSGLSGYASSSLWKAFQRYADGYPDPATGQCTRISTTYKVWAVRALISHSPKDQKIAQSPDPTRVASAQ